MAACRYVHTTEMVIRARGNAVFLMRFMVLMAAVNVSLSVALASSFGMSGVIWGTVFAFVFCLAIPYSVKVYGQLKQMTLPSTIGRD
jgi:hypothetical protein